MRKEAARKGMAAPDEEAVRREHLRAGVAAPDLATIKDFLRFYIATSKPRLDADKPTVDSINIVAEWFFAGFTRITGTETDEDERSEVYNVSPCSLVFRGSRGLSADRLPVGASDFDSGRHRCQQTPAEAQLHRPGPYSCPVDVVDVRRPHLHSRAIPRTDHFHYPRLLLDRGADWCLFHGWLAVQGQRFQYMLEDASADPARIFHSSCNVWMVAVGGSSTRSTSDG